MNQNGLTEGEIKGGHQRDFQYRRLDLPLFNGEEAFDWVSIVERYFQVNRLTKQERLTAADVCMEGDAFHWLQ